MRPSLAIAFAALASFIAAPAAVAVQTAPDGTRLCPDSVHDRYTVKVRGHRWPTWHPPYDRRHRCAFGHEHGSNPRAFRWYRPSRRPAFGRTGAFAGSDEPHAGFKVFVANDDGDGLGWMIVLHQGSGSPRRGSIRFHSLEAWVVARGRGRRRARVIAHTRHMADFGRAVANCPGAARLRSRRLLPHPGCRSAYERWDTGLDVGGVLRGWPGFAIANPITQFDPGDPGRLVFNKRRACGPHDPAGWDSYCKGDRRTVLDPRWRIRNRGPSRFRTDALGRRARRGIPQYVRSGARVDQRRVREAFTMEQPSDGGLYRPGRGLRSASFEWPGYCVLRRN